MINVDRVTRSFGARVLLRDASLRVGARDRVALVGPNGSGKTTLLEMVVGTQAPDEGRIEVIRDVVIGYLPQETDALRGRDILTEVMSAAPAMSQAGHRLEVLEREIAQDDDNPEERAAMLAEFTRLQGHFDDLGGYTVEAEARIILSGLAFADADLGRPTDSLSGGWLMRVALAKLLLSGPDVLLLDEPTNHLDLESMKWLERFLRAYEGAIVLVSHDRDFINALVNKVTEIRDAKLVSYTGDYEAFVTQRELEVEQLAAAARNQQKRIAHTEAFITRFRYKASKARQVQSRIKMLDKVERIEAPKRGRKAMKVGFPQPPRSGQVVIDMQDIDFAYGDKPVYNDLGLSIERGEKVALVGPNGAGKTTLLKLLAGVLTPTAGERKLGHNVALGYFAQHQIEALDPGNRVIAELERAIPPGTTIRPRDLLGRFMFSVDDSVKPVSVLSGGERTRLALAKLLVTPVNFLCLDEPTNHLDITSRDVLEDALIEYSGTIVLITHDRHLIRSVANRIVEVTSGVARSFLGTYDDYLWRKEQEQLDSKPAPAEPKPRSKVDKAELRKMRAAVRRIESQLDAANADLKQLEATLADPALYTSRAEADEMTRAHKAAAKRVTQLETEWERLTETLESTG
jgi:ATP-binding cassette subfamily F protein 3